jgi:hypothetical protein
MRKVMIAKVPKRVTLVAIKEITVAECSEASGVPNSPAIASGFFIVELAISHLI